MAETTYDGAAAVALEGISKRYSGGAHAALEDVSLKIEPGTFFGVLGPSGCGKTTMLRVIAGFERPDTGRVLIGSKDVTSLSPRARDIAMVFQNYALYPHMTIEQNLAFNLRNRKVSRPEIKRRVHATVELLHISHLLKKKPAQLSGGEQQRVALGRALIRRPRVFLMDEPLSNLDLKLRESMRIELGRLHAELGVTTIYVTHDQAEAMTLSQRLAVMSDGRLQQVGTPDEVYARPATTFVARFMGSPSMNLLRMRRYGNALRVDGPASGCLPLPSAAALEDGQEVIIGVRPHDLEISREAASGIPVIVRLVEHLGRTDHLVCEPERASSYLHRADAILVEAPPGVYSPSQALWLTVCPEAIRMFTIDGCAIVPATVERSSIVEGSMM